MMYVRMSGRSPFSEITSWEFSDAIEEVEVIIGTLRLRIRTVITVPKMPSVRDSSLPLLKPGRASGELEPTFSNPKFSIREFWKDSSFSFW